MPFYLKWFNLEPAIYEIAKQLILTSLLFLPIQVTNMIIGDGVLRSGGQNNLFIKNDTSYPLGYWRTTWNLHSIYS